MWISEKLREGAGNGAAVADLGITTIGGEHMGAFTRGEVRNLDVCTPKGMIWRPSNGDQVLVVKGGPDGEEGFVVGVKDLSGRRVAEGELYLYGGGTSIHLRNDGVVSITGRLMINGEEYQPHAAKEGGR